MSNRLWLRVVVDVDDDYERVHNLFKRTSVQIEYYHSFAPPDHVEYTIGPLTKTGVENWKNRFDEIGCRYAAEVREEIQ